MQFTVYIYYLLLKYTLIVDTFKFTTINRNNFMKLSSTDERNDNFNKISHNVKSEFLNDCITRGMISQSTNFNKLDDFLYNYENSPDLNGKIPAVYYGIDLTSNFIHEGTLFQLFYLRRFLSQKFNVVIVIGEGTTSIGDPSYKERRINEKLQCDLSEDNFILGRKFSKFNVDNDNKNQIIDVVKKILSLPINVDNNFISPKLSNYGDFYPDEIINTPYNVVFFNNKCLYNEINLMEYLETVCKNMNVGRMLSRDSMKLRINRENGGNLSSINMNLSELLYMSLQALDFIHLANKLNVKIQLGGSDQMGNIISGIELGDSLGIHDIHGITTPLLQDKSGVKFSKSSSNSLFKITKDTKPLSLWCHFRSIDDDFVRSYLNWFTTVSQDVIDDVIKDHINKSKILLSDEITRYLYGDDVVEAIHKYWLSRDLISIQPYFNDITISADEFKSFYTFISSTECCKLTFNDINKGVALIELLNKLRHEQYIGSFYSNRQSIKDGICKINGRIEDDLRYLIKSDDVREIKYNGGTFKYIVIQVGKRSIYFVEVTDL